MILMVFHFILNFLGTPNLVYSGAVLAVTAFLSVLFLRWEQAFFITILYTLVSGQIKLVLGYQAFFRLMPDFLVVILVVRNFVKTKKIFDSSKIPDIFVWLLAGHTLWFFVELFNPQGAGIYPSLASGKFYILPLFYFFTLLNHEFDPTSKLFKDFLKTFMFFVILEGLLVFYQSIQDPEFMFGISKNYLTLFEKYKHFSTAAAYRPWGTTAHPGGYANHFFLSTGFIFLWTVQPGGDEAQRISIGKKIFLFAFTLLSVFGCFISQVRSSFMKEVFIISLGIFFSFLGTRFLAKRIIGFGLAIFLTLGLAYNGLSKSTTFSQYMSLDRVFSRYEEINTVKKAAGERIGFLWGVSAISQRLKYPMGVGLGMTTKYLPQYEAKRKQNIDVDQNLYWAFDNFFAHVITEMGWGGLFLVSLIVLMPFVLASLMISALRDREFMVYRIICYCFVSVLAITIGQWGTIGIIYPPEFQFYWLYVAIALTAFYKYKPKVKS